VLKVIENALSQYYGPATQIASNDLRAVEKMVPRGDVLSDAKVTGQTCRGNTVFVLLEENVPRQRSAPASQGEDSEDVEVNPADLRPRSQRAREARAHEAWESRRRCKKVSIDSQGGEGE